VVVRPDGSENEKPVFDIDRGKRMTHSCSNNSLPSHLSETKATTSPFLFLAVDLPPPPLFQDAVEKNIIPQVGIHTVLAKYDGVKTQVRLTGMEYLCQGIISLSGIEGSTAPVQLSTTSAVSYRSLQEVYEEQLCRREKSNHRKLSLERS
jgi:hypothetical protein